LAAQEVAAEDPGGQFSRPLPKGRRVSYDNRDVSAAREGLPAGLWKLTWSRRRRSVGFFRFAMEYRATRMSPDEPFRRYQELQAYVGWTDAAARRVAAVAGLLDPHLPSLVDDFYEEIERHPDARKVITGGAAQIARLKGTLLTWVRELLAGNYDEDYVGRRWRVGWRHVEIGLDQVYTNAALSRLRFGLCCALQDHWTGAPAELRETVRALNQLLDLDLAIIEDAYQTEHRIRQQRSERLAAIGQVAGGVAHELRNPLNVVKTSVYYLLNARNATPEKTAEHLKRIERHVVLADGVITALSNFARLPVPNLRPVALGAFLREVLEVNPLPDNCPVSLDVPASLPAVLADPDQLRIVFGNLVRNAREAMPQGGPLALAARQADDRVEVEVRDAGVGIPPDKLAQVMEPLYSTKARGLGLGLAIARAILEKNQGSLRVVSEVGRGSTFTVALEAAVTQEDPGP
jgi:signal transduction histidine kinase